MHVPINVKSPNNISEWQMGFNSAFNGLKGTLCILALSPSLSLLKSIYLTYNVRLSSLSYFYTSRDQLVGIATVEFPYPLFRSLAVTHVFAACICVLCLISVTFIPIFAVYTGWSVPNTVSGWNSVCCIGSSYCPPLGRVRHLFRFSTWGHWEMQVNLTFWLGIRIGKPVGWLRAVYRAVLVCAA